MLFGLSMGVQAEMCSQFMNCHDCLKPSDPKLNCGWCSPDPAEFANGSVATRCMDHTSQGWDCFHLYMHDGCIAGYVCDQVQGKCILSAPGMGDTLANCEKKCGAKPQPHDKSYVCNTTTAKCEIGIGGQWKQDCESSCGNFTPAALVGLWRGFDVQKGFKVGEFEMNFTAHTVSWGPYGSPQKTEAVVTQLGNKLIRLTLTAGLGKGDIFYASFTSPGWPLGPETTGMSLAIQREGAHQLPPENTWSALGDHAFDVFVMHACNSWSTLCNFQPVFNSQMLPVFPLTVNLRATSDACQKHADCSSCIADPSSVCGWCDGVITHSDGTTCGNDGKGCCGGATNFSKCNVAYRKECPVMCDWKNWTQPVCRHATPEERANPNIKKYQDCDIVSKWGACKYEQQFFYCDVGRGCQGPLSKAQCRAEPRCNVSSPDCDRTKCKAPHFYYCDKVGGRGCLGPLDEPQCNQTKGCDIKNPTCDPNVCKVEKHYICDSTKGQCSAQAGPAPPNSTSYNTSTACDLVCSRKPIEGTWRAISISKGFVADEWDFNFGTAASGSKVTYRSKLTGDVFTGTYTIGAPIDTSVEKFGGFEITITLKTGEVLKGLFNDNWTGPITKFMFLGLPIKSGDLSDNSFDHSMELQEFVLISCLPDVKNCDFSSVNPASSDLLELLI